MEDPSRAEIVTLLRAVRRRWVTARAMSATARTAGGASALLAFVLGADRIAGDPLLAALGVAAAAATAALAIRFFGPFRRLPDDRQVARYIEEHCPELEDRLTSAVAVDPAVSPLGRLVVDDAVSRVREVELDRILDAGMLRRAIAAGAGAIVAFAVLSILGADVVSRIAQHAWLYASSSGGAVASDADDPPVTSVAARIERIDVAYAYPAYTRLAPRVDRAGGDVFAPEGTTVTITVHTDAPVHGGALHFASGTALTLTSAGPTSFAAAFDVTGNDTYRVALAGARALDAEYVVRATPDAPPRIEIRRPGGDREITSVEEVVIEVRAEDDYALDELALVYTVAGRDARIVDLLGSDPAARVTPAHTIYAEQLDVAPGDVITYHVRARDANPNRTRHTRSAIYFLTVRPFAREYQVAMARSGVGMDADTVRRLADMQKEIVAATWRIEQEADASASVRGDLTALADAQGEVRERTLGAAAQMLLRGRSQTERDAMAAAVAAMEQAEAQLRIGSAADALPPELEALNQLLRVEAAIRRLELSFGQGQGSSAWWQPQEDLSSLFDRDLRREQQTNYEEVATAAPDDASDEESDALRRVRELAARQQALNRARADLARQQDELDAEDAARILARLTREQQELRAQAEALERSLEQAMGTGGSDARTAGEGMSNTAQARAALNQLQAEARAGQLASELQAAEAFVRRLEATGQLGAGGGAESEEPDGGDGTPNARQPSPAPRAGETETKTGAGAQGEDGTSAIGSAAQALLQQLEASPALESALRAARPGALEDLARWAAQRFTGSAPGTEAFTQDYAAWESLRAGLRAALERIVADRAAALRRARRAGRVNAGPDDAAPEGYEAIVDRYYRSLADAPGRGDTR